MTELGAVRKGRELGYANKRALFLWAACRTCGVERWVMTKRGQPISLNCKQCALTEDSKARISAAQKALCINNPERVASAIRRMSTPEAVAKRAASRRGKSYLSEEQYRQLSKRFMGAGNPFYGRVHTDETRQKMASPRSPAFRQTMREVARARAPMSEETKEKIRTTLAMPTVKQIMREKAQNRSWGSSNSHWLGGISFEPYSHDFNGKLKHSIRHRDRYRCNLCGRAEASRKHDVHHIDYDKRNTKTENLITLCVPCHGKTSHRRTYWQRSLSNLVGCIGGEHGIQNTTTI